MHYFLVTLTYKASLEEIEHHRPAHRAFLDHLVSEGTLLLSGPQNPLNGGILIVRGTGRENLEVILSQDPFALHQLADYDFIEFTPTKWTPHLDEVMPKVEKFNKIQARV
ncbi:MAG: YciI family protein [Holosporales bacterium]